MNFFKLTFLFTVFAVSLAAGSRYQDGNIVTFEQYKAAFNKHYDSDAAEHRARENFKKSAQWLADNRDRFSHSVGFTSMSDRDPEFPTGLILDRDQLLSGVKKEEKTRLMDSLKEKKIEKEFDWRKILKDRMPPVTKQAYECGTCWAHASAGAMSANLAYRNNLTVSLSIQELVECSIKVRPANKGYGGGTIVDGFNYTQHFLVHSKKDYPSKEDINNPEKCKADNDNMKKKQKYYIRNYSANLCYDQVTMKNSTDEQIQAVLAQYGPIIMAIAAPDWLSLHTEGIIENILPNPTYDEFNHAVVLVGWGYDKERQMDYWIIRNSWGQDWGENGYFRVQRGINSMGINHMPVYLL